MGCRSSFLRYSNVSISIVFAAVIHGVSGMFYYGMDRLHRYIQENHNLNAAIQSALDIAPTDYFPQVIATCKVIAICHAVALGIFFAQAWRYRGANSRIRPVRRILVLRGKTMSRDARRNADTKFIQWVHTTRDRVIASSSRWNKTVEKTIGADFHQFEVIIEILLQTFQAYKMSQLVAVVWINRLLIFVIVMNCWLFPFLDVLLRKKTAVVVRLAQLVLDTIVDVVYGMVIPFAIFYPYYRDFDGDAGRSFRSKSFMDTWFINATADMRQLLVTSWLDFFGKMAPGVGLLFRSIALQTQLRKVTRWRATQGQQNWNSNKAQEDSRTATRKRTVNFLLFLWGLLVLALHLGATIVSLIGHDRGCLLETRPFLSSRYTCAVFEVSCTQKGVVGSIAEMDTELHRIDPYSLKSLIISHCESLSIPPRIQAFPKLQVLKIHNSTIGTWGEDAALTAHWHPNLKRL